MALRRPGTKNVKKVVGILTDPHPEFVSLVEHGANQTPFKVVKAAGGAIDIHKITFDKGVFKDEASVTSYLEQKGYSEFQVADKGDTFEIEGVAEDEFDGDLEVITAQKGVTMTVGRTRTRKAASAATVAAVEGADTQTAPAADTTATKGAEGGDDTTSASTEAGSVGADTVAGSEGADTVAGAADADTAAGAAGADAVEGEAGADQVTRGAAFMAAFSEERVQRSSIGDLSELAYLVRGLVWAAESRDYDEALNGAQAGLADQLRACAAAVVPVLEVIAAEAIANIAQMTRKAAGEGTDQPEAEAGAGEPAADAVNPGSQADTSEATKSTEQPEGSTDAGAAPEGDQEGGQSDPAPVEKSMEEVVAEAVAKAVAPLQAQIAELTAEPTTATKSTEVDAQTEVAPRQTRKSGDIEEVTAPSSPTQTSDPETVKRAAFDARQRRNLMGI